MGSLIDYWCLWLSWTFFAHSQLNAAASASAEESKVKATDPVSGSSQKDYLSMEHSDNIGIATGNWGCGAFGGDPQVKAIIQWLATSQVIWYLQQSTRKSELLNQLFELLNVFTLR